jgi:hypothetical protein
LEENELESDKFIKFFRIFIGAALVVSLVMNFSLFSRLDHLENQMNVVTNNQYNTMNTLDSQTSHIQTVLNDFKNEQSWIGTINMDVNPEELENGKAEATFKWQVKELQNDAEVVFNYAYAESEDYITIPAKKMQQGLFQVKVPIEVKVEPQWEIGVRTTDSNTQQKMRKKEMEKKRMEDSKENTFKYFVSVSDDDMVKSGEIHTEDLGHLATNYYGFIQIEIDSIDKNLNVTLLHDNVSGLSNSLEEAYLLKYEGERLIEEEQIESDDQNRPPDHSVRFFHLDQVEKYEDMRLVVKVVYSNEATFEKEVYKN